MFRPNLLEPQEKVPTSPEKKGPVVQPEKRDDWRNAPWNRKRAVQIMERISLMFMMFRWRNLYLQTLNWYCHVLSYPWTAASDGFLLFQIDERSYTALTLISWISVVTNNVHDISLEYKILPIIGISNQDAGMVCIYIYIYMYRLHTYILF